MAARRRRASAPRRRFDARPDTIDFRDRMFEPTLTPVPAAWPLERYLAYGPVILDQGQEGACTGFGLAAVVHHLIAQHADRPDAAPVSPHMLYHMAKRYDEWPGTGYEGSSARGAMKGWHKHGVCSLAAWPQDSGSGRLTARRAEDAAERPLGAYLRVNHKDLVAMHTAIAEVGILYATAVVHTGWSAVGSDGVIPHHKRQSGGHAFAIVAYDSDGFWIQNSWGPDWGRGGFCFITYSDWLDNGMDVWVAQLGVPIRIDARSIVAGQSVGLATKDVAFTDTRPHVVTIGNDGALCEQGTFANAREDVEAIFRESFPAITRSWRTPRILLYAHGGLVSEKSALQRAENYIGPLKDAEVYPVAFIWKTDYWTTLSNMLEDALRRRRSEGALDSAKDFMLDRLDDALEPIARTLTGKAGWDEMKENGERATTTASGGARLVAGLLAEIAGGEREVELHVAAHSAGSIFMAPLVQLLCTEGRIAGGPMDGEDGLGLRVETCTLWAPACTVDLFEQTYLPAIESRQLRAFTLFNLTDEAERDDHCAHIYNKSLLYLVSNAFEERHRIPLLRPDGEPILGMDRFVTRHPGTARMLEQLFRRRFAQYVTAPNQEPLGSVNASRARHHGDFDDDDATVRATLARILARKRVESSLEFPRSRSSVSDRRRRLDREA